MCRDVLSNVEWTKLYWCNSVHHMFDMSFYGMCMFAKAKTSEFILWRIGTMLRFTSTSFNFLTAAGHKNSRLCFRGEAGHCKPVIYGIELCEFCECFNLAHWYKPASCQHAGTSSLQPWRKMVSAMALHSVAFRCSIPMHYKKYPKDFQGMFI